MKNKTIAYILLIVHSIILIALIYFSFKNDNILWLAIILNAICVVTNLFTIKKKK